MRNPNACVESAQGAEESTNSPICCTYESKGADEFTAVTLSRACGHISQDDWRLVTSEFKGTLTTLSLPADYQAITDAGLYVV